GTASQPSSRQSLGVKCAIPGGQCAQLAPRFLRAVYQLRQARLPQLVQLGDTLHAWSSEIATMWPFSRNNGITEGFHNKMELISRQAFGFRNFENYRMRVKVLCG